MKISFIGGGNMGEAMLAATLGKGLVTAAEVTVSDINAGRRQHLEQRYGVAAMDDNRRAIQQGEVVVLAVKPQNLKEITTELKGHIRAGQLVMSIIAGEGTGPLTRGLGNEAVIRVMPNTPAQIGAGMSVWTATGAVTPEQRQQASSILGTMGRELYLDDEDYIDMATAVSGSGPAYIFLMIEALTEAAVGIGLPRTVAEELVLTTVVGSGLFAQKSGRPPVELRRAVTSPGGTTAAAIEKLEAGGFGPLIARAVRAAHDRARELGSQ